MTARRLWESKREDFLGVLIVDDDLASAAALQAALQRRSFAVLGIEFSPRRALCAAVRSRPDLIVLNVRDEWPERDLVVFQLALGGAAILLVGAQARSRWMGRHPTRVHYLAGAPSATEIASAVGQVSELDRCVA